MRSLFTGAACLGFALMSVNAPLPAQSRDSEPQLKCENQGYNNDRPRHCEVRELTVASIGRLGIDSGQNGGVSVKGWQRGDVLVRARIEAQADTEGAAAILASRVLIDGSGGQVRANGPETEKNAWWSVSYEVFVPQATELTLKTHNGGINISDVHGRLSFEGLNGGVNLKRVSGEITGRTVNGGINVELAGSGADARQMDLTTVNGGVTVTVPQNYSARVQTETGQGRVQSDFPIPSDLANARSRRMDFSIGAGGPPVHITTTNGSIRLKRAETR
jgi:DUF4097 and DUF4098 domain-containing protein YvlB